MALVTIVLQDVPVSEEDDRVMLKMTLFSHPELTRETIKDSPAMVAATTAFMAVNKILGDVSDE